MEAGVYFRRFGQGYSLMGETLNTVQMKSLAMRVAGPVLQYDVRRECLV